MRARNPSRSPIIAAELAAAAAAMTTAGSPSSHASGKFVLNGVTLALEGSTSVDTSSDGLRLAK